MVMVMVSEGVTDIFKSIKGGYYCNLVGRCLMDNEKKFREVFTVWRDSLDFILNEMKEHITKINNKIKTTNINSTCMHVTRLPRVTLKSRFGSRCGTV